MAISARLVVRRFVAQEFSDAELGDARRSKRLTTMAAAAAMAPGLSFPDMAGSDGALEGTYRFFNNDAVSPDSILAVHYRETAKRIRGAATVVISHDTSEFTYGEHERDDLDAVGRGSSFGFRVHMALAVEAGSQRRPLGLIGLLPFEKPIGKKRNRKKKPESSQRWSDLVSRVRERVGNAKNVIHAMDREADDYALLAALCSSGERFVVRQQFDRRLHPRKAEPKVRSLFDGATATAERTVQVSERRPAARRQLPKRNGPREARAAQISVSAATVSIPRPANASATHADEITLNLVHAVETDAPAGCEPIEWWIWTTEPISTGPEILFVLDCYRCRWVIEEYFKALKTGCALERRQLESKHALLNALALFCPIAWRLLLLRTLARADLDSPATTALTPTQILALRGLYLQRQKKKLKKVLSAREALWAIAKVGGHITNNGDPGWMVIGRGFERILDAEAGILLARGEM